MRSTKSRTRRIATSTAYKEARNQVAPSWRTFIGKMSIIGGKSALAQINKWCQETFKFSFTNVRLATELRESEIDAEVRELLTAIEFNEAL
ncbi:MAG TPA: hypothetical protein VG759_22335 [Candidatus Angelobacter sp.]|nr:hypothetical protein [Candidatus Angelobacter sp.]